MDFCEKLVLKIAGLLTGQPPDGLFTYHRALLSVGMGITWWDESLRVKIFRNLYWASYIFLKVSVTLLTLRRCFQLDTSTGIGFMICLNNVIVIFTFVFSILKSIYIKFFFAKETKGLMDWLLSMESLRLVENDWKLSFRMSILYFMLLSTTCILWTIYFISVHHMFSYQTDYPWDQDTIVGYYSAFTFSFMSASFCGLIHSTIDSLVMMVCGVMVDHLVTLKNQLQAIGLTKDVEEDFENMAKAVELHVRLIKASEKMNDSFSLLFASQSVYTVLHACVTTFSMVKAADVYASVVNSLPMLFCAYTQLLLYCFYGQRLTDKFEEVTFASYNNRWYQSSSDVKNGLQLISRTSLRKVALRGVGTYCSSHQAYLNALQDSISYYLILKTITASEEDN